MKLLERFLQSPIPPSLDTIQIVNETVPSSAANPRSSIGSLMQPGGILSPIQKRETSLGEGEEPDTLKVIVEGKETHRPFALTLLRPSRRHHCRRAALPGSEAHGEYARVCTPHESSKPGPRGDDSFTALELTATRSGRTMTAAHAASLILNKCFKVQTPGARNV